MQTWFRRSRVALETALAVAVIAAVKLAVDAAGADFITLSPLFTSVLAGGVFVTGLLVAGTLADYKEAEKVPSEIRAIVENIVGDVTSLTRDKPSFDMGRLRSSLAGIVSALRNDLAAPGSRTSLQAIDTLNESFLEMDVLGVQATYISRLRNEQSALRRTVLRIYQIQRTAFLPSAHVLIKTVVGLIITALVFTELDPLHESIVVLLFISYFFIYLTRLLGILDTPFRVREKTMDDVSLFLLDEAHDRLRGENLQK